MPNTKVTSANNRQKQKNNKRSNAPNRKNQVNPARNGAKVLRYGRPSGDASGDYLAAIIAPFNSRAHGSRVPDDIDVKTGVANINSMQVMQVDAGGVQAAFFRYHPTVGTGYGVTDGAGKITSWSGAGAYNSNALASLTSIAGAIRTVGYGVRLQCPAAPANITGNVHIALIPDAYLASSTFQLPAGTTSTFVSILQSQVYYQKLSMASLAYNDVVISSRPIDSMAYKFFNPQLGDWNTTTNANANLTESGWMSIIVYVEGFTPSAKALEMDTIHHFEYLPAFTASGLNLAEETSPVSPSTLNGVKAAARELPPVNVVASGTDVGDNSNWWGNALRQMNISAIASSGLDLLTGNFGSLAVKAARSLTNSRGQKLLGY